MKTSCECFWRSHFARVCAQKVVKMMFRAHTHAPLSRIVRCAGSPDFQVRLDVRDHGSLHIHSSERTISEVLACFLELVDTWAVCAVRTRVRLEETSCAASQPHARASAIRNAIFSDGYISPGGAAVNSWVAEAPGRTRAPHPVAFDLRNLGRAADRGIQPRYCVESGGRINVVRGTPFRELHGQTPLVYHRSQGGDSRHLPDSLWRGVVDPENWAR